MSIGIVRKWAEVVTNLKGEQAMVSKPTITIPPGPYPVCPECAGAERGARGTLLPVVADWQNRVVHHESYGNPSISYRAEDICSAYGAAHDEPVVEIVPWFYWECSRCGHTIGKVRRETSKGKVQ